MIRKIIISLIVLSYYQNSTAQECENIRAEYDNNKVFIYYDLTSIKENTNYYVYATCSKDVFKESLKYVSGAVGKKVKPGKNLQIIWDCKKEYNELNLNDIDFKVAALETAPTDYFPAYVSGTIKRGNKVTIGWFGGSSNEDIYIELYRNGAFYKRIVSTLDLGSFQWEIQDNIEKGSGYQVKINTLQKNELYSNFFEIK